MRPSPRSDPQGDFDSWLAETGEMKESQDLIDWEPATVRAVPLTAFGESYRRYRVPDAAAEGAVLRSLARYGQMSPVVVCLREERPQIVDGFKRLAAARR